MSTWTDFLEKVKAQNFGPDDSQIVSSLVHPARGLGKFGEFLQQSMQAASQAPMQGDNQALRDNAAIGANNLAGLMQTGAMPFAPSGAGTLGTIKAWHGSPHKFTQFKDEAIGTGEGAQAFGMGHYSGEDVAALDSHYRKRLSHNTNNNPDAFMKANPNAFEDWYTENIDRIRNGFGPKFTKDMAKKHYKQDIVQLALDGIQEKVPTPSVQHIRDWFEKQPNLNGGFMYELNLKPDPEDLLHFDKTLVEHPKEIQDKIKKVYEKLYDHGPLPDYMTGKEVYSNIAEDYSKDKATEVLRKHGIPGHSFAGQGGKGKPNYVMYDPKDIEIKRRIKGGLDSPVKGFVDYIKGKK
jgi:hypothetical protein